MILKWGGQRYINSIILGISFELIIYEFKGKGMDTLFANIIPCIQKSKLNSFFIWYNTQK